jgi:hypothetical protein
MKKTAKRKLAIKGPTPKKELAKTPAQKKATVKRRLSARRQSA